MNITRGWKRIVAVGCSHGEMLSRDTRSAVLGFMDRYKPHYRLHLGDAMDTTAFRSGASGTKDEGAPVAPDIQAGLDFLADMRATHAARGNHEARIYDLQSSPNAIKAECARLICQTMEAHAVRNKYIVVPWGARDGWFSIGGFRWGHGILYGENYIRDSAETFGNCVVAHGHRAGIAHGRRFDDAQCFAVGTLAEIPLMEYAKARRSTLAWSAAVVYGEVADNKAALWLAQIGPDRRMPL